jgi:beta-phosphoglucomutase-like phosphatase (HAD superfamily)
MPFEVTVCGDEVPATKPDPAPYRQAVAALDVSPAGCVVVEASSAGARRGWPPVSAVLGIPGLRRWRRHPG